MASSSSTRSSISSAIFEEPDDDPNLLVRQHFFDAFRSSPCKFSIPHCKLHAHTHDISCSPSSFLPPSSFPYSFLGWCPLFDALLAADSPLRPLDFLCAYLNGISRIQILCFLDFHLALRLSAHPSPHPAFLSFLTAWIRLEWQTFLLPDHLAALPPSIHARDPSFSLYKEYPAACDAREFRAAFWAWATEALSPRFPETVREMHRIVESQFLKHAAWRALFDGSLSLAQFAAIQEIPKYKTIQPTIPRHSAHAVASLAALCCRALSKAGIAKHLRRTPLWSALSVSTVLDVHPDDFARQLQLAMFRWYPFCFTLWGQEGGQAPRDAVLERLVEHFNRVRGLLEAQLYLKADAVWFEEVMAWGILVARRLLAMNNLDGLVLLNCAVLAKKPKGCALPSKLQKHYDAAQRKVSSDSPYLQMRRALSAPQSVIPFAGMLMTDLTFIVEGNRFTRTLDSGEDLSRYTIAPAVPIEESAYPLHLVFWPPYTTVRRVFADWHDKIDDYMKRQTMFQPIHEIQRFIDHAPIELSETEMQEHRTLINRSYRS